MTDKYGEHAWGMVRSFKLCDESYFGAVDDIAAALRSAHESGRAGGIEASIAAVEALHDPDDVGWLDGLIAATDAIRALLPAKGEGGTT
jgi:hypothetical protein